MYHLRLIKGLSYMGMVEATQQNPDVFIENKTTADAALASGYFKLLEISELPAAAYLNMAQLSELKLEELKKLAADLGADVQGLKNKAEYIEAIAALEVGPGAGGEVE